MSGTHTKPEEPVLFTQQEVAEMMRLTVIHKDEAKAVRALRYFARKHGVDSLRIGRQTVYTREQINELLSRSMQAMGQMGQDQAETPRRLRKAPGQMYMFSDCGPDIAKESIGDVVPVETGKDAQGADEAHASAETSSLRSSSDPDADSSRPREPWRLRKRYIRTSSADEFPQRDPDSVWARTESRSSPVGDPDVV